MSCGENPACTTLRQQAVQAAQALQNLLNQPPAQGFLGAAQRLNQVQQARANLSNARDALFNCETNHALNAGTLVGIIGGLLGAVQNRLA